MAYKATYSMWGFIKAQANYQWKMLAKAKLLHKLVILKWAYQVIHGVWHDGLASSEEAELSSESTQLFLRKASNKC